MQNKENDEQNYLIQVKQGSKLDKFFPNLLSGRDFKLILYLSKHIKEPNIKQQIILEIQQMMNKFIKLSKNHIRIFQPLMSVDVIYNKQYDGFYFHVMMDCTEGEYICSLSDIIHNTQLVCNWQRYKQEFVWIFKSIKKCLQGVKNMQEQNEYFRELCFDCCIVKVDSELMVKIIPNFYEYSKKQDELQDLYEAYTNNFINTITSKAHNIMITEEKYKFEMFLKEKKNSVEKLQVKYDVREGIQNWKIFLQELQEGRYFQIIEKHYEFHIRHTFQYISYVANYIDELKTEQYLEWIHVKLKNNKTTTKDKINVSKFLSNFIRDFELVSMENSIVFSKKHEVILYIEKYRYYNYTHFELMIKKLCKSISKTINYWILDEERINIFYELEGQKTLINTPIRGKNCKHLQFFDLQRVYLQIINSKEEGIECYVCGQWIELNELVYLQEIETMLQIAKYYHINNLKNKNIHEEHIQCFININHLKRTVNLQITVQPCLPNVVEYNQLYQYLMTPLYIFKEAGILSTGSSKILREVEDQLKHREFQKRNIIDDMTEKFASEKYS